VKEEKECVEKVNHYFAGILASHRWSSLSYFLLSEILDKIITPVQ
jgi:hypothetical protein